MATKTVVFPYSCSLPCAKDSSPLVILCLESGIAVDAAYPFIEATILRSYASTSDCCVTTCQYVLQYDTAGLLVPTTALLASDITGIFCEGCLTEWVQALTASAQIPDFLIPSEPCAFDIGDNSSNWRDMYLCGEIILSGTPARIHQATLDGFDSASVQIGGGGAISESRGALIKINGNENASAGSMYFASGSVANSGIQFQLSHSTAVFNLLKAASQVSWTFDASTGSFSQNATDGGDLVLNKTVGLIRQGTADGADSNSVQLAAGGAASKTRGAYLSMRGNEFIGTPGVFSLHTGDTAGSVGHIYLEGAGGEFQVLNSSSDVTWTFKEATGTFEQNSSTGGDLVLNATVGIIRQGTADAGDTKSSVLAGGGAVSDTRGGYIQVFGNEASTPGGVVVQTGDIAGAPFAVFLRNTTSTFDINQASAQLWQFLHNGDISQNSTNGGNLLFNKGLKGVADNVGTLASAGNTQANAASVVNTVTIATGADATKGVKLPPLSSVAVGTEIVIINQDATNALNVYSDAVGELIFGQAGTTAITVAPRVYFIARKTDATNWYATKSVAVF